MAAYSPVGAADLAASYVNLQNPGTYNAAPGVAPSFNTSTGWTFNGTSQWLSTGYVMPRTGTYLFRYANASGTDGRHGALYLTVTPRFFGTRYWENGGGSVTAGTSTTLGVIGASSKTAYHNGASVGTISAGTTADTLAFGIGARAGFAPFAATDVLAAVFYSTTLSGAEMATLTTRMNALPIASAKGLPIIAHHHHAVFGGG